MSIEITPQLIHSSFASVIRSIDKDAHIYDNPNQQGTEIPAWFIVHRAPVEIQRMHGIYRTLVTYSIDIWYMVQQNITRLWDIYSGIANQLDAKLTYLPIYETNVKLHVYDRSWSMEMNAMKYSTTLRIRTSESNGGPPPSKMDVLEDLSVFLKNNGWPIPPKGAVKP